MQLSRIEFSKALQLAWKLKTNYFTLEKGVVSIGRPESVSPVDLENFQSILEKFKPYRKGPFCIYGIDINANWKSDNKLDRLLSYLHKYNLVEGDTSRVCDIGCNNGYFLAGLSLASKDQKIIGVDPTIEFYQFYRIISTLCPGLNAQFLPFGYDVLSHFSNYFQLSICMGLLYHVTDPMHLLRTLRASLASQGHLILETIIYQHSGEFPVSLVPSGKYAGMRGVWNIPDKKTVLNWLKRSGFHHIDFLGSHDYRSEQVRTTWGDLPALDEVLSGDKSMTIEGYPPPVRAWFLARR